MEAVIEQAEALTSQYPGAYVVWNILGASRAEIGMFDLSVYAYKTSIFLSLILLMLINIGVAFKSHGKLDEAIEAYKKSISLKPNDFDTYCNMGWPSKIKVSLMRL